MGGAAMAVPSEPVALDHLVVVAGSLAQGVAWCEETLGITPGPGGAHARMGTHNRLFSIAGPAAPGAYAEIIAIDPEAPAPAHPRWFGMDEPGLRAAVARAPRLVHAVVRTTRLDDHRATLLAATGIDAGPPMALSRPSQQGELRWRLTVRGDGMLPVGGAVPTLIEWEGASPGLRMPGGGVRLAALRVIADDTALLATAYAALGWNGVALSQAPPAPPGAPAARLQATLETPRGVVTLSSGYTD